MDVKIDEHLEEIETILDKCEKNFSNIDGYLKLKKKLESEKKFLNSLKSCDLKVQETSLKCLNLNHFKAVINQIEILDYVVSIFKPFKDDSNNSLVVDIVCDHGYRWIKVLARNPQALHYKFYCEHNSEILRQAEKYLLFSKQNEFNYKKPLVQFYFSNGITQELACHLEKYLIISGLLVEVEEDLQEKLKLYNENEDSSDDEAEEFKDLIWNTKEKNSLNNMLDINEIILESQPYSNLNKINLDVSTIIAYVSDMTNGYCEFKFDKDYLNQQAESERKENLLPILENFFKGRELFVCETAYKDCVNIIYTIGGSRERKRFENLMQRIKIIPDEVGQKVNELKENKKIKKRTKIIFGTGESQKAITTTANSHFVRAAINQGISFSVFIHQPRALTEQKTEISNPVKN